MADSTRLTLAVPAGMSVSLGMKGHTVDVWPKRIGRALQVVMDFRAQEYVGATHLDALNGENPCVQIRTLDGDGRTLIDLPTIEVWQ